MNNIRAFGKNRALILIGIGVVLLTFAIPVYAGVMEVVDKKRRGKVLAVIKNWKTKIKLYAGRYDLQPSLVAAIIAQESSTERMAGDPNAMGNIVSGYGERQAKKKPNWRTHPNFNKPEIFDRAWGMMQIMYPGYLYLLYGEPECYSATPSASFLLDPDNNMNMGCKLLKQFSDSCGGDLICTARKYYGTGLTTILYANSVIAMANTVTATDFA